MKFIAVITLMVIAAFVGMIALAPSANEKESGPTVTEFMLSNPNNRQ